MLIFKINLLYLYVYINQIYGKFWTLKFLVVNLLITISTGLDLQILDKSDFFCNNIVSCA